MWITTPMTDSNHHRNGEDTFATSPAQQTQNICTTFVQRQPNVFDAGPTLYQWYTHVLCILGVPIIAVAR